MANPSPLRTPSLFDLFWLNGEAPPGITKIKGGGNRSGEWQDMQVPGTQGQTSWFRFEKVGRVTYEIKVWTEAHMAAIGPYLAMLEAGFEARPPTAFKLTDFRFAHNKIATVAVDDIGPQILDPGARWWTYDVSFKQAKPRRPFGGVVKAPANARERLIADLSAGNAALQTAVDVHNAYRAATKKGP